jgi:hypothetical protein
MILEKIAYGTQTVRNRNTLTFRTSVHFFHPECLKMALFFTV